MRTMTNPSLLVQQKANRRIILRESHRPCNNDQEFPGERWDQSTSKVSVKVVGAQEQEKSLGSMTVIWV